MAPHHRPSWQFWAGGLGALALFTPLQTPSPHFSIHPFQDSEGLSGADSAGSREWQIGPAPPVVTPPVMIPVRERRAYRDARSLHRGYLGGTDRSVIPNMMQTFRRPPKSAEEYEFLDWLAERDAMIDRAQALGYVIGELGVVVSGTLSWSAIGTGQICGAPFVYPTGGQISRQTSAPRTGDATLMNRRWAMLDADDLEPRPYIPIPRWFLLEPTVG